MSRVVVIGAGVGGLAAAARLAALGHAVTVLEQHPVVGGKLGVYVRDGFRFDTGPSLLTLPGLLDEVFTATGAPHDLVLEPVEPAVRYRFADGTSVEAGADADRFAARLDAAVGPGAGAQWLAVLRYGRRVWEATEGPFLSAPLPGLAGLGRLALRRPGDLALIAPWRSLRSLGSSMLTDARLRMVLDRYATYSGSDPRRAPAALASIPYVEQRFGSWHVAGGLRRIADALVARAAERGAVVRTGCPVTRVELSGGRVSGVRLAGGGRVPADVVVAGGDAAALYGSLLPARAGWSARARLARATPSLSGFVLLLGLRGRTPDLAHHTVLFPADYDAEFDAVFGGRPATDPTLYVCAPRDPALAPPGCESWFVLANAARHDPARGCDWRAPGLAGAYAGRLLDLLAARGMDVRSRVQLLEARTPADLQDAAAAPGGSIYGTSSNGAAAAFLRPANRSPVPGLFLVGGSAHPGGGLPLVLLSARIVAGLVGAP